MTGNLELMAALDSFRQSMQRVTDVPSAVLTKQPRHIVRREGDEWACACGARWGVGEAAPAGHHGT